MDYPFHDWTSVVTRCGRVCFNYRKVSLSQVFAGQQVGVRQVTDRIWLVSFARHAATVSAFTPDRAGNRGAFAPWPRRGSVANGRSIPSTRSTVGGRVRTVRVGSEAEDAMTFEAKVQDFLAQKRIAVAGVSRDNSHLLLLSGYARGYKRGNNASRLSAGKRNDTGPFGVADASNPSPTSSLSRR